jgi:hypothetical protein
VSLPSSTPEFKRPRGSGTQHFDWTLLKTRGAGAGIIATLFFITPFSHLLLLNKNCVEQQQQQQNADF